MATNFNVNKWAKSADSPSFVALHGIPKRSEYRNFDFNRFTCDDLATSCRHLMNFGPVTTEFMTVKGVHPLVDQQFGYVRLAEPLLKLADDLY